MTEKKYVILTDIKEFTYKNALLTDTQVEKILGAFDSIVLSAAEKYDVSVIKSIGDAYLCFACSADIAYKFGSLLISESQKYDAQEKIEIKKMSLRSSITYGDVTKNKAMKLDDYFGECINLASRIVNITPKGKIFTTGQVVENIGDLKYKKNVGEHSFHGVLTPQKIYSLSEISQEEISDLSGNKKSLLEECDIIIFRSACVSAILSAQPIPFLENFNIIGVHLYMIIKISQKLEKPLTLKSSSKVFKKVISPLGLGYFGLQGSNTVAKIVLPGIGGYLFSPLSFAVTYAMGKIYTSYLFHSVFQDNFSQEDIKKIFIKQKNAGKILAKKEKINILKIGKKFYSDVLHIKKQSGYSDIQKDLLDMLKNKDTKKLG